jgi:hypothetical protein
MKRKLALLVTPGTKQGKRSDLTSLHGAPKLPRNYKEWRLRAILRAPEDAEAQDRIYT